MFEYIKGTLALSSPSFVAVDVHGVGYRLHIPVNNYAKLPALHAQVLFYISFVVREDAQKLFGFLTQQERDLFEHLNEISGIGPKTALALIGHMEMQDLQSAIASGNIQRVCKIPGIGKKTAERLIVEMRDKIFKICGKEMGSASPGIQETGKIGDAISALVNLGYNASVAQKAVESALKAAHNREPELALLITSALRYI
jgi:holliday junction DNA helicase RuvA